MSLAPRKSLIWDASPGVFEFRWGAPPESGIEPGASNKHNSSVTLSPALIAIFVVLGSAFLIVSYYKIFTRFCKSRRWRPWRRRRRGFESEEVQDISQGGLFLQDSNGWQIYSQSSYGLDEAVIKSIPLCMFRKEEKFVDEVECSVCLVEFKDDEALRILPKCSHAFHISCIDVWLRSHANCPLCRANVVVFNGSENPPWVPAMAGRIRPNLEHGIAGVVHDRFRSDEVHIIDNITNTNNDDYVPELQQDSEFQNMADIIDLEIEGSSGNYYDDLGGGENLEETVNGCLNLQPVLSRSYSFGCSSNENLNFSREFTTNPEVSLDSLLLTETASSSPWKKAFKRFNSPFSTKGGIFSLRSPFFNRSRNYSHGGSTSNFSSTRMFPLSPARDHHHHHHQRRNYSHGGGGGLTRIRGGSLSPPFMRVNNQRNRAQSMTSPLFMKRSSFSLFTPNRLRSGDPEALLSPDRFKHHENL